MKKQSLFICILIFILAGIAPLIFIMPFASAVPIECRFTAEDYATEVLLNKDYVNYNLDSLKNAENILRYSGNYIFKSFYRSNLYTILSEQQDTNADSPSNEKFLSVRLQIPVKEIKENISYFRITSFRRFNYADLNSKVNGWVKVCNERLDSCVFEKNNTSITIEKRNDAFYGYIDFLNPQFNSCYNLADCSGKCMYFSSEKRCISNALVEEIDNLVTSVGIAKSFDDFVMSRKTEQGTYSVSRLIPENEGAIRWEDAMKEELLWLRGQDIIHITERDIMEIAILSDAGRVNDNRVFYGINEANSLAWTYRSNKNSRIAGDDDCNEFPQQTSGITGFIIFDTKLLTKVYILVPLLFTGFIIMVLLILFIAAKIIGNKKIVKIRRIISR